MKNKLNLLAQDGTLIKYCGPGGNVTIPEGVAEIAQGAFLHCFRLTSILLPN